MIESGVQKEMKRRVATRCLSWKEGWDGAGEGEEGYRIDWL